jgi:hypothetical protein
VTPSLLQELLLLSPGSLPLFPPFRTPHHRLCFVRPKGTSHHHSISHYLFFVFNPLSIVAQNLA